MLRVRWYHQIYTADFCNLASLTWQTAVSTPRRGMFSSPRNGGALELVTALFALEESFAGVWFEQKEVEHAKKIKLHDSTRKNRSGGKIELRLVLTLAWKIICSPTSTSIQPLGSCLVTCDFTHLLFKSQIQTQILELAEMMWIGVILWILFL